MTGLDVPGNIPASWHQTYWPKFLEDCRNQSDENPKAR